MATNSVEMDLMEPSATSDTENRRCNSFEGKDSDCEDDEVEHQVARYKKAE